MKRFLKLFLLICLFGIGVNFVKAECDMNLIPSHFPNDYAFTDTSIRLNSTAGHTVKYYRYDMSPIITINPPRPNTNMVYAGFCRDAGYYSGFGSYSGTSHSGYYVCQEEIFNTSGSDEVKKSYEAGVVAILKNGYSSFAPLNQIGGDDNNVKNAATAAAIRIFQTYWKNYDVVPLGGTDVKSLKMMRWYHNKYLNDSTIKGYIDTLKANNTTKNDIADYALSDVISVKSWTANSSNITSTVESEIVSLLKKAFMASINYLDNGAATLTWSKTPSVSRKAVITDENGIKHYEVGVTYRFSADHFKSNPSIKLEFDCKNCSAKHVNYKFKINNGEAVSTLPDNFASYLDNGKGEFYVTIVFTGTSGNSDSSLDYDCGNVDYGMNLKYYDDSINVRAFNMISSNATSQAGFQRFYVMVSKNYTHTADLSYQVSLCGNGGDEPCDPNTDPNCPPANTVNCGVKFNYPKCSENDTEFEVSEGYQIPNNQECKINTNTSNEPNILKCIINNEDIAGNKYQAKSLVSNKYCSVYCKEDYKFNLPGIKHVNSGRFFHLEVNASGTKSCYTSKIDAKNEFNNDLEEARKNTIDKWNEWNKWKTYIASGASATSWNYSAYDYNGRTTTKNATLPDGDNPQAELNNAKSQLENAINAYFEIVNEFNRCSGNKTRLYNNKATETNDAGWIMKYNYEPELKFWYQEGFKPGVDDLVANNTPPSAVNQGVCTTEVTDAYGCPGHWLEAANMSERNQFVCYVNAETSTIGYTCGTKKINISTAKYVKQTMSVNANYFSTTQYYSVAPSGTIVVGSGNQTIENATELFNALPVALDRQNGVYNYVIYATKLGEYYNEDGVKLGRIWGGGVEGTSNSVVNTILADDKCTKPANASLLSSSSYTLANNSASYQFENGVYVCQYRVNCPDPDCDVECPNCISITRGGPKLYKNFEYRQITTNDFNPNNRELGSNWKTGTEGTSTSEYRYASAVELKAKVTKNEIISAGEKIYDEEVADSSNVKIKFKVNGKMINAIKSYNKQEKNKGGYFNNSLTCYDYGSYSKVMCYSELIDTLFTDYSDRIEINVTRPTGNSRSSYTMTGTGGYWTFWDAVIGEPSRWNVTTEQSLSYYQQNYGNLDVGPSWK